MSDLWPPPERQSELSIFDIGQRFRSGAVL